MRSAKQLEPKLGNALLTEDAEDDKEHNGNNELVPERSNEQKSLERGVPGDEERIGKVVAGEEDLVQEHERDRCYEVKAHDHGNLDPRWW